MLHEVEVVLIVDDWRELVATLLAGARCHFKLIAVLMYVRSFLQNIFGRIASMANKWNEERDNPDSVILHLGQAGDHVEQFHHKRWALVKVYRSIRYCSDECQ